MLFLEKLNIFIIFKLLSKKNKSIKKKIVLFNYNDRSILYLFLTKILKYEIIKYDLEINNYRFINNECVLSKIYREDLFKIQNNIIEKFNLKKFIKNNNNFYNFLIKNLIEGHMINDHKKIPYTLLLFYKIIYYQHLNKLEFNQIYLLNRDWKKELYAYANLLKLNIIFYNDIYLRLNKNYFILLIKKIIISFSKNFIKINNSKNINNYNKNYLYFEKLGEFNLKKNYKNTDFFFLIYSNLEEKDVIYETSIVKEKIELNNYGIKNFYKQNNKIKNFLISYNNLNEPNLISDNQFIKNAYYNYNYSKNYWKNFFLRNEISFYLSWNKYRNFHISISDAINEIGGVSAIWERSFESQKSPEYHTVSNILFKQSFWNLHESQLSNNCEYIISTGFLRNYSKNHVDKIGNEIKNNNFNQNVNFIFAVFDQNSNDEFTNKLLNENYYNIIKYILDNKNLGVVFKPKKSQTLYKRLPKETVEMINYARDKKKCYIFDDYGEHQSNIPVITAASIADLCIHTSLKAGTAAIECALFNKPTVIIDQEGYPKSKLNELREYNSVFDSWSHFIEDFRASDFSYNNKFGLWGNYLNQFNDFNDDQGSYRMGNFIKYIISGLDDKKNAKNLLKNAYFKYKKEYGNEKAISIYD